MQSMDLDMNASEMSPTSSFNSGNHNEFSLETVKADTILSHGRSRRVHAPIKSTPTAVMETPDQSSKKLSIVLSKEMHRLAKMQALKEDVTLKDLVVRLIQDHLRNA